LPHGRALVVDAAGLVIADSGGGLKGAKANVKLGDLMPGAPASPSASAGDAQWLSLPLRGTSWTLLAHLPHAAVQALLIETLRPYFAMAITLMLAIMGLAWVQNQRYARPALQLAEFMDVLETQPAATPPKVPRIWDHWFEHVASTAAERRRLWEQAQAHAVQLERTVEERTWELSSANEELTTTVSALTRVQQQMEQSQTALQQSNEILVRLGEIGKELTSQLSTDHVFETIHQRLDGLLDATSFRILLIDAEGKSLSSAYGIEDGKRLPPLYQPLTSDESFAVRCFAGPEELYFQSFSQDDVEKFRSPGTLATRSALFFPLLCGDRPIGVMTVQSVKECAYSDNDKLVFRTLCSYAAIALENALTYAKLREAQQQLVASEKFSALGSMVVGVAHELNTPIGNCLLVASTMESRASELQATVAKGELKRGTLDAFVESTTQATQLLLSSLHKAAGLVQSFKRVAEDRTSEQRRSFDLAITTQEILSTLRHQIDAAGHRIDVEIAQGISVDSYPGPYGELLTHMVVNALSHAFNSGVSGMIRVHVRTLADRQLEWTFSDDGQGISEEHLKKIFDPFFTTRLGQGSNGLGLSVSYNIATALFGGHLAVQSTPGAGTVFRWQFPMQAPHTA
jgi:signal transduction histidine kinase